MTVLRSETSPSTSRRKMSAARKQARSSLAHGAWYLLMLAWCGYPLLGATAAQAQSSPETGISSTPSMDFGSDAPRSRSSHAPTPADLAASAQDAPTQEPDEDAWGWSALPIGTFSPETQLGLGAFGALFFRLDEDYAEGRPSNLAGVGLLTTRGQVVLELLSELYWDRDRNRFWSKVDYRYYPNAFWGIGPDTKESEKEWYVEDGPRVQAQLRHTFVEALYLEGRVDAQFMHVKGVKPGGLLDSGSIPGSHVRRVVGLGVTLGWDTRDHSLEPLNGGFYELSAMQFHQTLFSEFSFARLVLNMRRYIRVRERDTIALQAYGEFGLGDVPFHRLALIGGQHLLRGYFEGRYRDKVMLAAQAEYRMHLLWRFGAVAFMGAGDVGPALDAIPFSPLKWSIGGGLRLQLTDDERINLRADAGFGVGTFGFYAGIGEAF